MTENQKLGGQVKLSGHEMIEAIVVGGLRQVQSIRGNSGVHVGGAKMSDTWSMGIEGALGEMAFAKWLGCYWSRGDFRGADVSGIFEVRTTEILSGHLIVRPQDHDDRFYVLVVGCVGTYRVVGWLLGECAKQKKYLKAIPNRDACYWVPQSDLNDAHLLKRKFLEKLQNEKIDIADYV